MMGSLKPRQVQRLGDEWRMNNEANTIRRRESKEGLEGRDKAGRGVWERYLGSRTVHK